MSLCPPESATVSPGERRPQGAAVMEVTHAGPDHAKDATAEPLANARDGYGGELLRPEGEERMLRGHGEGGLLRSEAAAGDVRLSLGTEAVWKEFHGRLRAYVGRRVRRADVDDIVQKVFLEIHRGLPRLRRRERVAAWLFRAAHNAVVDHYRSPARRREVTSGGTTDLDSAFPGAPIRYDQEASEWSDAAGCLLPMVATLRTADRDAIEAIELRGLTQKEAAERTGISLTAMKARVQRARRRLKTALLECCEFVLDARGGVVDCASRARPHRPACRGTSNGKECHDA